jgi:2-succinyl-5-enolpyruvyl-6-hydroxy-3-cyclohexene-1-carboxylate synthase
MSGAPRAADVQAAFAATLVDEWVRAGVTDAVVAPGSRSTPVLAALAEDGRLRLHVVLDERSAGFVALGLGLATGRPAPVVTTSGTASVELHPAVVEAHQAGVPLLAVTADRPPELHGVGAPQTIEQEGLYPGVTRWSVSPGVPDLAAAGSWRSLAARSVAAAVSGPGGPGPVHLNLAFREPLLGDPTAVAGPAGRAHGGPWHRRIAPPSIPPAPALVELVASFAGRRGILVAGAGAGAGIGAGRAGDAGAAEALLELGRRLGWPILADPRSGVRVPEPGVVAAFDALLRAAPVRGWVPEIVVRVGRPSASKVLGQWLAALPERVPQVLVDPDGTWSDPDRRVELVTASSPAALAAAVTAALEAVDGAAGDGAAGDGAAGDGAAEEGAAVAEEGAAVAEAAGWLPGWQGAEAAAQAAIGATLGPPGPASPVGPALSEPGIARRLVAALPDGAVLVASSSMPVRDVEWFAAPRRGVRVVSNRGANGIDGVVSTAIGVALGGRPTVALVGDLAFAYDAGALLWATSRDIDCTFVLVDNDGGGIFSFLPQAAALPADRFEQLWGTPHGVDLLDIAAAYGVSGSDVASPEALSAGLADVGTRPGVRVLRCRSERAANVGIHDALNAAVAAASAGLEPWPDAPGSLRRPGRELP